MDKYISPIAIVLLYITLLLPSIVMFGGGLIPILLGVVVLYFCVKITYNEKHWPKSGE